VIYPAAPVETFMQPLSRTAAATCPTHSPGRVFRTIMPCRSWIRNLRSWHLLYETARKTLFRCDRCTLWNVCIC